MTMSFVYVKAELQEYEVSGPLLQNIQYLHIPCLVYHGDTVGFIS